MAIMKDGPGSILRKPDPYDPYGDISMDSIEYALAALSKQRPTLPDGRYIKSDGLVHIYSKGSALCTKAYHIEVNQVSTPTEDNVNCPVCVISSRKMVEDLINPPEKKPEDKLSKQGIAAITAQMQAQQLIMTQAEYYARLNSMVNSQGIINTGNSGIQNTHQGISAQTNAQAEAQEKLIDAGFFNRITKKLGL